MKIRVSKKLEVNKHFEPLLFDWDFDILLCVGSYGSGKSHEMFTKVALEARQNKRRIMVVRKEFNTHRESTFEDIEDAIDRIGANNFFKSYTGRLHIKGRNGSEFIFKGMDKASKIKSIKNIDLIIIEEASDLNIADIKELFKRLRSEQGHMILMTNPVSFSNSVYRYFFTKEGFNIDHEELYKKRLIKKNIDYETVDGDKDTLKLMIHHSIYTDNKRLPPRIKYALENEPDPVLKRIGTTGKFGLDGDKVFINLEKRNHIEVMKAVEALDDYYKYQGLDFGYQVSFNAFSKCAVDDVNNILYIYGEFYKKKIHDYELAAEIKKIMNLNGYIYADSEDPGTIDYLQEQGLSVYGCKKFPGSKKYNIRKLKSFKKIVISELCPKIWADFDNLAYKKDKNEDVIEDQFTTDPHGVDSAAYALNDYNHSIVKGSY